MCSHFESVTDAGSLKKYFDADISVIDAKQDVWPGYQGVFVRAANVTSPSSRVAREARAGSFGLIPHWATDTKIARNTYNARVETVGSKPSFRESWKQARHCIIPAVAIYEPDWRSGRAIPTRISRADNTPMGIAGLWDLWQPPKGDPVLSFTMLTINADQHELMQQFHKPADEKRMVVILPEAQYENWLTASSEQSMDFMRLFPAQDLSAEVPAPTASAPAVKTVNGSLDLFDTPQP